MPFGCPRTRNTTIPDSRLCSREPGNPCMDREGALSPSAIPARTESSSWHSRRTAASDHRVRLQRHGNRRRQTCGEQSICVLHVHHEACLFACRENNAGSHPARQQGERCLSECRGVVGLLLQLWPEPGVSTRSGRGRLTGDWHRPGRRRQNPWNPSRIRPLWEHCLCRK